MVFVPPCKYSSYCYFCPLHESISIFKVAFFCVGGVLLGVGCCWVWGVVGCGDKSPF